ncbi:hypothetical protein [Anaeromyxobacter paludicola]|uniref:Uncharacterized protein n=1 Tax=Anaeromyxobacter paludicola TaxID=2918171 RepID=A0ABM7XBL4_9BACT|nr:hypothetical protein [Anaeromyxobacter paludicola]BDG09253.1 hypothetical protein AMPC_23660 [Anaeromyxobacter paludicola]
MRRAAPHLLPAVALALALALAPCPAGADGLSLYLEPGYSHVDTRTTDAQGHVTTSTVDELTQRYSLGFSRSFAPLVRLEGNGLFEDDRQWSSGTGLSASGDAWRGSGFVRLHLGPPVLGGDLSYQRQDESTQTSLGGGRLHEVNDTYTLHLGWHPVDLPNLELRLTRADTYDVSRRFADSTLNDLLASWSYNAVRQLSVQYTLEAQDSVDHLSGTTTDGLLNSAHVTYGDTFHGGRTSVQANYAFSNRISDTSVAGAGGTVATQQLPSAGLSLVEPPAALPQSDTLGPNGLLVDGKTDVSANLNLGWSASIAGDTAARELGLQFADPTTQLNTLYVYVQRPLPPEISTALSFTAWRSDDNLHWTQVALAGTVIFNALLNRYELTLQQVQAPFVKLVVQPLPPALTTDRRYADVLVTELQAYQVVPAAQVRGRSTLSSHSASLAMRQQLTADPLLAYDFAGNLSYSRGNTAYTLQNGLSLERALRDWLKLAARVARQDTGVSASGTPGQHDGAWQYSASLAATPLPTLTHALTYSGQLTQTPRGSAELNSATLVNRAALYRGVDLLLSTGYAYNLLETGAVARGPTVVATASLIPNRVVTLSSTYAYSSLRQTGGGLPDSSLENERVDGALSISPFPALYLSTAVQRIIKGTRPTTLATFSGGLTPFPDGSLLLRLAYTESLDTALDAKTHAASAGARWNFSPHAYLDLNYSLLGSDAPTGTTDTRSFTASLAIQL